VSDAAAGGRLRVAVVGAGIRGAEIYGGTLEELGEAVRVVAVAEPDPDRRARFARRFALDERAAFDDWRPLLDHGPATDLAIVATPDAVHVEPAVAALRRDLHVLLEKPIAPTPEGVRAVASAAASSRGTVAVAHVLRHTPFFVTLTRLLGEGAIGRPIGIEHVENVGFWHFAHSYVRGAWRREALAAPMLLAKACHDLDLLRWMADAPCEGVRSTGERRWFRAENAPAGAPDRCLDGCPVEATCPYSAPRIYLERFAGTRAWPRSALAHDGSDEGVLAALRDGPYGRCVYRCDNDVVDHQATLLRFAGGLRASLVVTAFSTEVTRTVRVVGSHGEIAGHFGRGTLDLHDFASGEARRLEVGPSDGHAEADRAFLRDLIERLGSGRRPAGTDLTTSLDSHFLAFAAERSRHEAREVRPETA
jgi:predicted dehydrogenase